MLGGRGSENMAGGGVSLSGGDSAERGGGMKSGSRAEGALGSRQDGTGSSSGGIAVAVTRNEALWPQTHHPSSC
jgi:hypothetical protein